MHEKKIYIYLFILYLGIFIVYSIYFDWNIYDFCAIISGKASSVCFDNFMVKRKFLNSGNFL